MAYRGGTVVELDIQKFFDALDHKQLIKFLRLQVCDGVLLRLIGKWLAAGVMEAGALTHPEAGTPQGGVISPLLANVYLHYVLDLWFEHEVKPRLKGKAELIRYADDAVIVCKLDSDAAQLMVVLPKRFGRFGLTLHPDKTRQVRFERPDWSDQPGDESPGSFDFLGFTFCWGKSRRGKNVVRQKTAKDRFARALKRIADWCRQHRHDAIGAQHQDLSRKLNGHYGYYGVTGNGRRLEQFAYQIRRAWHKWLSRRSRPGRMSWARFNALPDRLPLPPPRVVHSCYGTQRIRTQRRKPLPAALRSRTVATPRGGRGWRPRPAVSSNELSGPDTV
jgi:RNA-directed DNA polymerase